LISDYRMELHSSGEVPEALPQKEISAQNTSDYSPSATQYNSGEKPKVDINFSMNISKQSELVELLKIFQNQIDTIKNTIDKLIKTATTSSNVTSESKVQLEKPKKSSKKRSKTPIKDGFDDLLAPAKDLSDLPPKPESLKSKGDDDLIGLPKLDAENRLKPVPKLGKKAKKSDLVNQKNALENKLGSVKNLIDFIEKKYASKQMDKKSYEKRVSQLKSDLKKTQDKIDEIEKQL